MGSLMVKKIDLNDRNVVINLKSTLDRLVRIQSSYYRLDFKPKYYFEIPGKPPPSERGWYIILTPEKKPIYVGRADDLNRRLNSNDGSRDNFGNPKRRSDSERNFVKRFVEVGFFGRLTVCIVREKDICSALDLDSNLTDIDRGNIEKTIDIFRSHLGYL